MCGVLGYFHPEQSADQVSSVFRASLNSILHRGPDSTGVLQIAEERLSLGHNRLAIVDLSALGAQPMVMGPHVLVYNGEIYNHNQLKKGLHHPFKGHSDTETLLAGLNQVGVSFLNRCRGMFAGGYFHKEERTLTIFRDPFGIKPMYYTIGKSGSFAFASEIKALLSLGVVEPSVDAEALKCYLHYENFPQQKSLFSSVVSLLPGEVLKYNLDNFTISKSFLPPTEVEGDPNKELEPHDLRQIVSESVKAHMLSDVPIAVYLSGGLDSSTVATMAASKDANITGFTGYFDVADSYYDETSLVKSVASKADIDVHYVKIDANDFKSNFEKIIYHLDEPRMGMGSFSQFMVAKKVAESHKVVMAGHGGDEFFAGYSKFKTAMILSAVTQKGQRFEALKGLKRRELPGFFDSALGWYFKNKMPATPDIFPDIDPSSWGEKFQLEGKDLVSALQKYYIQVYLPGLLMVEDRVSMAWSLETRVPLIDHQVISAARQIPLAQHLENGELKAFLKKAVGSILPPELLNAPKRGFPTPLRLWFREELFQYVHERILDDYRLESIFQRAEVEKLLKRQKTPHRIFALDERRAHQVWQILSLNIWASRFGVSF